MNISILTPDSPRPNHAAMKIAGYHKALGDKVVLNIPLLEYDKRYVSVLFDWTEKPIVRDGDLVGGPGVNPALRLPQEIEAIKPDYSIYPRLDHSIGYTYRACMRGCEFCKVPAMKESRDHISIWTFHDPKFKKIRLLNNNTLEDPKWRETFEEIQNAGLTLIDESGFDARLITEEKAVVISNTKIEGYIHLAFDQADNEKYIRRSIKMLANAGIKPYRLSVYVLVGFDTTPEEDMHRIEVLRELGANPFVMPYNKKDVYQKSIARWANHKAIFKTVPWNEYGKNHVKKDINQGELNL